MVYPGFQFDQDAGRIREAIPGLIAVIREYGRTDEDLAQWMCDPSGYLDGGRPADYLDEPERVLAATEAHYGIEW
ncbi:antitoxin Xre/MbcA/ParS toxin-binding domain-containing protein [Crystallibacter degradans]|uniref:antitoxin Xre/MbcA/ParS toxin-binding domain-containing protein n=1 Tax=Crystallibacter degradans TaxID=2726743 RepID=UPI001475C449|nr:3-deoxy-7-phosphoheptulonate synthase [Arthrobacter sp. SF27]